VFMNSLEVMSSYCGSTTLYAEFWPSQPIPSISFYPEKGSSNLALLTSVYFEIVYIFIFNFKILNYGEHHVWWTMSSPFVCIQYIKFTSSDSSIGKVKS